MKYPLTTTNPHGATRYGFAWQKVAERVAPRHLDMGCHNGKWLASLTGTGHAGLDLNRDAIESGRRSYPQLDLRHALDIKNLPFAEASFDSVSMLDVLEHMDLPTQQSVIQEVFRVLKLGGEFIATVPRRHAFSFLDLGNLKFVFPRLHRIFYTLRHGRRAYNYRYLNNPFGLVGDVMATKRWHQHFSPTELQELVTSSAHFEMSGWDGSGFFLRALVLLRPLLRRRLDPILEWDARNFQSANLFMSFKKN